MSHRKRSYHHFSDYPLARFLGFLLTVGVFAAGYWSIEVTYDIGISSLAGLAVPCSMVFVWGFIKQRDLWFPWACFAFVCMIGLGVVDRHSVWRTVISYSYWFTAMATCLVLIFSWSKVERRVREMKGRDVKIGTVQDPVKDAFLEELFAD